jgi:hypothetical protein
MNIRWKALLIGTEKKSKIEVHGAEEPLNAIGFSIEFGAFKLLWFNSNARGEAG